MIKKKNIQGIVYEKNSRDKCFYIDNEYDHRPKEKKIFFDFYWEKILFILLFLFYKKSKEAKNKKYKIQIKIKCNNLDSNSKDLFSDKGQRTSVSSTNVLNIYNWELVLLNISLYFILYIIALYFISIHTLFHFSGKTACRLCMWPRISFLLACVPWGLQIKKILAIRQWSLTLSN